jgi:hypothetical protein
LVSAYVYKYRIYCAKAAMLNDEISIYSEAIELRRSILCIICLEPYSDPVVLPCSHAFCRPCILEAFNSKKKCPVCSAETSKRSLQSFTLIQPVVELVSELIDSLTKDGRYSIQGSVLENHYKKHQGAINSKPPAQQSQDLQIGTLNQQKVVELREQQLESSVDMCVCVYVCMCVYMCICMCVYVHICTYEFVCVYIYTYLYIFIWSSSLNYHHLIFCSNPMYI